jgi:hypothetical protein
MTPMTQTDEMMAMTLAWLCAFNAATQHMSGISIARAMATPALGEVRENEFE